MISTRGLKMIEQIMNLGLRTIANGPAAHIGDLYLSNAALFLVVVLAPGLITLILWSIV